MSKRIYIGNLSFTTNEERLNELFSEFGEVVSAEIIKDRDTNQSKGFGFIEMSDDADCDGAIAKNNGREVDGRRVRVNYAEEKKFNRGDGRRFDRTERSYGDRNYSRDNRSSYGSRRDYNDRRSSRSDNRDSRDRSYRDNRSERNDRNENRSRRDGGYFSKEY
ncbi:MAG: RNA-binding protein [Treponema sp.]|nr:RNA-binding protein [Treponema sp.]MEE1182333.1 RNA-binding protein [Treponema sp.]